MPTRKPPKKRRSGKKLLALVVALGILAFGWVHIVHGSSSAQHSRRSTAACHAGTRHKTHACPAGVMRSKGIGTPRVALHRYAVHLTPVLSRARKAFDGAAAAVQATDLDTVDSVCGSYGSQITILASETDGVPHPGPWYQPVSELHHSLLGLFHDMQGALQVCQTASENADYGALETAREDVATADEQIRSTDDHVVGLARR